VINGTDWQNTDLPMLNYKGYNYLPAAAFKDICALIGVEFTWDNTSKNIIIETRKEEKTPQIDSTGYTMWINLEDYTGSTPFLKNTEEGVVFYVRTTSKIYNLKYESPYWYVREKPVE
jgi:hypothetical protein